MIAVLITCHNRKKKTISCLTSLFDATLPKEQKLSVFLVDDGSVDGTGEAVKKKFPKVHIIQGDGNLFWNRGMHLAWEIAAKEKDFDYYLWLNDDIILKSNSIIELLRQSKYFENKVIVCGAIKSGITGSISYGGYTLKTKRLLIPNETYQKCDYFNGNIVLIPSYVFKIVGYLDPVFQHGIGDFDYGLRAKKLSIESYITSKYIGFCEKKIDLPEWCNPKNSFYKRLRSFYTPLGGAVYLHFIDDVRHHSLIVAIFHVFTIYFRLFFPILYLKLKK